MIAVRFYRTAKGRLTGFMVTGHSGAGPHGEDIVCAAVSALSVTAVNGLEKVAGIDVSPRVCDGFLYIRLPGYLSKKRKHDAKIILRTARLGLRQIANQYPRYVTIYE